MSTPEFNPKDQRTKVSPEDLPPLEPTAEVPPIHSDKLNNPDYWKEKYEGRTARVPKEHPSVQPEKTGLGWKKPAAALALVAATAAGVFGGAKALGGGDNNTEPRQEPGASAPATPGTTEPTSPETETETEGGPTEFSTEQYTNGEQLVRGFAGQVSDWQMAGATPAAVENLDYSVTTDEYAQTVAAPLDEAYIDSLFVDNWKNDESLRTYIEGIKDNHRIFLKTYIGTSLDWKNKDNPYHFSESLDSFTEESSTPDQIVTSYRYVAHDNFDEVPNAGEFITESQEGKTGGSTVTWVKEGSAWKVADVEYNAE